MYDKVIENNQVTISGEIIASPVFSHSVFGELFYIVDVKVIRMSDSFDTIPVLVSERLVDISEDLVGRYVEVTGNFRSYNRHDADKNRLILSVFARTLSFLDSEDIPEHDKNKIQLVGYVCKPVVYRKTPLGREIADMLLAVNRPYGKSDYIPCICWGRNARYASSFQSGSNLKLTGRIQSREYTKKLPDDTTEQRVAYEVSVSRMEELN